VSEGGREGGGSRWTCVYPLSMAMDGSRGNRSRAITPWMDLCSSAGLSLLGDTVTVTLNFELVCVVGRLVGWLLVPLFVCVCVRVVSVVSSRRPGCRFICRLGCKSARQSTLSVSRLSCLLCLSFCRPFHLSSSSCWRVVCVCAGRQGDCDGLTFVDFDGRYSSWTWSYIGAEVR